MGIKRRGFIGGLLTAPFLGKAALEPGAPPPFDLQAAKRTWRAYVVELEGVARNALWQGKDLPAAMAEVEAYKRLHPPPPHAKGKDLIRVYEALEKA